MILDQQLVADALPQYEIGGELGRGGWGVVLAGRHRQLGRDVAIKQLPRAFAADESIRARFGVEARLLASLDHPHIVPVFDYVERDGLCLLVMELLPGGTVWSQFTTEGYTATAAIAVVLACLAGLQSAHGHHVLHRDIKPENLMFSSSGALKVTDFGIAKVVGGEETLATRAGEVVGTPAYIAPEQARGGDLSPATDVYAVSTMLYELLCGSLPFADDGDAMALMFKHAFEAPEPLLDKAPNLPPQVAAVVMAGLTTDPTQRPQSAEAFGVALAEACTTAWGPGWLPTDGTPVMGASSIVAATERVTSPPSPTPTPTAAPPPAAPPTAAPPAAAPQTVASTPPATPAPPGAPPTVVKPPAAPVRATITTHARSAALADVTEGVAELVPLKEVVSPPAGPRWFFVAAAALAVLALVLALVGLATPSPGGTLATGSVAVNGVDATSGATVTVDLSKPIAVVVTSRAPAADQVQLSSTVLGQQVSSVTGALTPIAGAKGATVSLGGRYLVAGSFTGKLVLLHGGQDAGTTAFPAHTPQLGLLSVPGAVTVLLLLFVIAYAESLLRTLRRGKGSMTGVVGLTLIGALFGVAVVGVAWVLAKVVPTVPSLVVCAVLGAGAGLATGLGGVRIGKRRRFRRLQRRERQSAKAA
ncbi:MAG TPA: serine/threonine-protein kinase [Acidimicrobiales bacterium]|nr:serine/threonine-protein kinase [Acidimicrobiales bacterium]